MILSHKYKFIFTKPRKVASTSIEIALGKHCGPDDIITPNIASKGMDDDTYVDQERNWEADGYFNHISARRVKQKVGDALWNEYTTFTVVRNPWDMLVSRYFWETSGEAPAHKTPLQVLGEIVRAPLSIDLYGKFVNAVIWKMRGLDIGPGDSFETFMKKLPLNYSNEKYYFDRDGQPLNDFVIRYENLADDYKMACEKIGIPYEALPQLKTKLRKARDYRELYTPELRAWVEKDFAREIEVFGYSFDDYDKWNN